MKLRNKKTGEIKELTVFSDKFYLKDIGFAKSESIKYNTLAELNEEWEDYDKDASYWYISEDGTLGRINLSCGTQEQIENHKSIGNYFETKEEAEKAVEKLKAWERLKDKGFRINGWGWKTQCIDYTLDYTIITEKQIEEAEKDLDLLFGGEE